MTGTLERRLQRLERHTGRDDTCTCGRVLITNQDGHDMTGSPARCPHGRPWSMTLTLPDNGRDTSLRGGEA